MSRRQFVMAGLAGAGLVVLGACGRRREDGPASPYQVLQFFGPDTQVAGSPQRFPFGLGTTEGILTEGGPDTLVARLFDQDGQPVGEPITVERHDAGLPRPYWPLRTQLPAGIYEVVFRDGDTDLPRTAFSVGDPATSPIPRAGMPLPVFPTPTTSDPRGVDPICTDRPACPFHEVSLDEALRAGRPVALLVGTPAHCTTAICGPVLGLLEQAAGRYPDVTFVHAEVYTDDTLKTTTEAVQRLGLTFEPSLFVVDADGVVRHRLDVIFDTVELAEALDSVA